MNRFGRSSRGTGGCLVCADGSPGLTSGSSVGASGSSGLSGGSSVGASGSSGLSGGCLGGVSGSSGLTSGCSVGASAPTSHTGVYTVGTDESLGGVLLGRATQVAKPGTEGGIRISGQETPAGEATNPSASVMQAFQPAPPRSRLESPPHTPSLRTPKPPHHHAHLTLGRYQPAFDPTRPALPIRRQQPPLGQPGLRLRAG